ncbi:hypothetical protein AX15_006946 [Amanita polypyramis BW_CC]|nr:hypothetical protein AX15_006946 [Amanita polypyramis BW_CC]
MVSIANVAVYFTHPPERIRVGGLMPQIKAIVALMVSNSVVVIPCIYRLFRKKEQRWLTPITINIDSPVRTLNTNCAILSRVENAMTRDSVARRFHASLPAVLTSQISTIQLRDPYASSPDTPFSDMHIK